MANLIIEHKRGDTWDGMSFLCEELQEDGVTYLPVDLTGVEILIQFKESENGTAAFEFKTSDDTVTIPEPLSGEFFMMPRKIETRPNNYMFDVQLTYPDGTTETPISDFWKITNDISRST
jgi:hypothetical protein